jgi:hypothetical protein
MPGFMPGIHVLTDLKASIASSRDARKSAFSAAAMATAFTRHPDLANWNG